MDDDGRPADSECFNEIIKIVSPNDIYKKEPIFVNSLVTHDPEMKKISFPLDGKIFDADEAAHMAENGFLKGFSSPFNGTVVNKLLAEKIGFPRGEFFIRYDEVDYYLKAKKIGAFLGIAVNSRYYHPATSVLEEKKVFGRCFINCYEAGWKEYYKTRNLFTMKFEQGSSFIRAYISYRLYLFGLSVFKIKNRKRIKKFIKKGFYDAKRKRLGKIVEPGVEQL